MSNLPNDSDSYELSLLRRTFRLNTSERATPYRLGLYSQTVGYHVGDFGAHSERWVRAFIAGRSAS